MESAAKAIAKAVLIACNARLEKALKEQAERIFSWIDDNSFTPGYGDQFIGIFGYEAFKKQIQGEE